MRVISAIQLSDYLNELAANDPVGIEALMESRVNVNPALAAHPTVIVTASDPPRLGPLGLLNGLLNVAEERLMMQVVSGRPVFDVITPASHPHVFNPENA